MKYLCLLIGILSMMSAKKLRNSLGSWLFGNHYDTSAKLRLSVHVSELTELDLRGSLKKAFALNAALMSPGKSMVCSPVSALLPLGKLFLGAEPGESRDELLNAIGVADAEVRDHFKSLLLRLEDVANVTLKVVSRIYVSKDHRLSEEYIDAVKSVFGSSLQALDFKSPEASEIINDWVRDRTGGMIKKIVKPEELYSNSVSTLLVNVVYFSGRWERPFRTSVGSFNSPNGVINIPMMTQNGHYEYAKSKVLKAEILQIPYLGRQASFIIVLPSKWRHLDVLLRDLKAKPDVINQELKNLDKRRLIVKIPKFKIKTSMDLKDIYEKIGVKRIFSPRSELTKIAEGEPVTVSKVVQECVMDVNEEGTAASAATAPVIVGISLPETFTADRPFLFFVRVGRQQLFAGTFRG